MDSIQEIKKAIENKEIPDIKWIEKLENVFIQRKERRVHYKKTEKGKIAQANANKRYQAKLKQKSLKAKI